MAERTLVLRGTADVGDIAAALAELERRGVTGAEHLGAAWKEATDDLTEASEEAVDALLKQHRAQLEVEAQAERMAASRKRLEDLRARNEKADLAEQRAIKQRIDGYKDLAGASLNLAASGTALAAAYTEMREQGELTTDGMFKLAVGAQQGFESVGKLKEGITKLAGEKSKLVAVMTQIPGALKAVATGMAGTVAVGVTAGLTLKKILELQTEMIELEPEASFWAVAKAAAGFDSELNKVLATEGRGAEMTERQALQYETLRAVLGKSREEMTALAPNWRELIKLASQETVEGKEVAKALAEVTAARVKGRTEIDKAREAEEGLARIRREALEVDHQLAVATRERAAAVAESAGFVTKEKVADEWREVSAAMELVGETAEGRASPAMEKLRKRTAELATAAKDSGVEVPRAMSSIADQVAITERAAERTKKAMQEVGAAGERDFTKATKASRSLAETLQATADAHRDVVQTGREFGKGVPESIRNVEGAADAARRRVAEMTVEMDKQRELIQGISMQIQLAGKSMAISGGVKGDLMAKLEGALAGPVAGPQQARAGLEAARAAVAEGRVGDLALIADNLKKAAEGFERAGGLANMSGANQLRATATMIASLGGQAQAGTGIPDAVRRAVNDALGGLGHGARTAAKRELRGIRTLEDVPDQFRGMVAAEDLAGLAQALQGMVPQLQQLSGKVEGMIGAVGALANRPIQVTSTLDGQKVAESVARNIERNNLLTQRR